MPTETDTMLPGPDEALPLPHFEERLLATLRDRHASAPWEGPDIATDDGPATDMAPLPGPARPARRAPRVAAVAAVAVLVAGVAAAIVVSRDPRTSIDPAAPRQAPTVPPPSFTAPEPPVLEAEEQEVLDAINGAMETQVVHTQMTRPGLRAEAWNDFRSGLDRERSLAPDGAPWTDMGPAEPPALDIPEPIGVADTLHVHRRLVDHCLRQVSDYPGDLIVGGGEAEVIRNGVEGGELEIVGTEVVGGRELVKLGPAPGTAAISVVYLDPETLLPVETTRGELRYTFEYLPRTAENLALMVPPEPPEYPEVPTMADDDARRVAGCAIPDWPGPG